MRRRRALTPPWVPGPRSLRSLQPGMTVEEATANKAPMTLDFRPHPNIAARVDHVGAERAPVLVIENFAAEPQALIDHAAALAPFAPAQQTFYPGVRAPVPMSFVQAAQAYLDPALRAAFGLDGQSVVSGGWEYSIVTTPPAALTPRQRLPHIDSTNPGNLALLLYLSPVDLGGTAFYRHRATGFESISEARFDRYEAALAGELAAAPAPAGYIDGDTALFERTAAYDGLFNRLIAYRGAGLHSASIAPDFAFDPNPRTGRLTLNLFFHYRPS